MHLGLLKNYLFFVFSYWGTEEPNGHAGRIEECVEIKYHDMENSWNDISCDHQDFWICEKMIA